MQTVKINAKGAKRVQFGHPWVFKSDIASDLPKDAGIVSVNDHRGKNISSAFYSPRSQITLRMIGQVTPGKDLWSERIAEALERRTSLKTTTNAFRAVFAEADLIPSVIIDVYNGIWVVQTLSAGAETIKQTIFDIIRERYDPAAIVERNDTFVRKLEGLEEISRLIFGSSSITEVKEGSETFIVDTLLGQKTGAFLDQRQNRLVMPEFARGRCLDCFAYQGWFACHMAKTSDSVTSVDISGQAIDFVKQNAKKNGHLNIEAVEANAFDLLRDKKHERYDLIHLDPPAFVKNRSSIADGIRGYKEVNLRAMKMLKKGGYLMTSSCSQHLSREEFVAMLHSASVDVGRPFQIVYQGTQDIDHPILLSFPESEYLKTVVLRML